MGKFILFTIVQLFVLYSFAGLSLEKKDEISELINQNHEKYSFHGNVLIKKDEQVTFETSVGYAQAEWKVPNISESKFMIASLSKSFTAAQILILKHQGLLNLEDCVSEYIRMPKDSKVSLDLWAKLKIKHLLNHTGGLKRDFSNNTLGGRESYDFLDTKIYYSLSGKDVFIAEPGEKFYYSNFGYVILAGIIEKVGLGSYENQLRINIFNKAGMFNSGEYHRLKFIEYMADGYLEGERKLLSKRCCDDASSLRGSASLYSTTADLALWLEALTHSEKVFGFDLLNELFKDNIQEVLIDSLQVYGYGLKRDDASDGVYRIYHEGHEWGYQSSMSLYLEEKLQIIVLSNRHEFLGYNKIHRADELSVKIAQIIMSE